MNNNKTFEMCSVSKHITLMKQGGLWFACERNEKFTGELGCWGLLSKKGEIPRGFLGTTECLKHLQDNFRELDIPGLIYFPR